jgi:hypothetical protein
MFKANSYTLDDILPVDFMKNILTALFLLSSACFCDVLSTDGKIRFDIQSDGQAEMTLNSTGLGILTLPSSNLHVNGNAIISEQLYVGGSSGSSNLNVNGIYSPHPCEF